ncbi:MAG TPA: hypothetical protein VG860_00660 [Terriglobia bacterium]|jgi:hypothetical protein|nr:hypothetical protein [Terriglobia bacterium]
MSTTESPIDRLRKVGGKLFLSGDRLRYSIPAGQLEARQLLDEIRQNRDAVTAMLRGLESRPPSLDEVTAMLPPGARVVRYEPKAAPFEIAVFSVVTDAGTFFRQYLRDLVWRVQHPGGYAAPPLPDILAKLAEAGLTLTDVGKLVR